MLEWINLLLPAIHFFLRVEPVEPPPIKVTVDKLHKVLDFTLREAELFSESRVEVMGAPIGRFFESANLHSIDYSQCLLLHFNQSMWSGVRSGPGGPPPYRGADHPDQSSPPVPTGPLLVRGPPDH